jgi:hypothetical protein
MAALTGRIFWVLDDFNYVGHGPEIDYDHTVARVENGIVDEFMIEFDTTNPEEMLSDAFHVRLLREDNGTKYTGIFGGKTDPEIKVDAHCEVFKNEKKTMLFGTWNEDDFNYTWWAELKSR